MENRATEIRLRGRLIDSLYVEAMALADDIRSYFDRVGSASQEPLMPAARAVLSCEALKATSCVMNLLSWLRIQRALEAGYFGPGDPRSAFDWTGHLDDEAAWGDLPPVAKGLLEATRDLMARGRRLEGDVVDMTRLRNPAIDLLYRLERAL